jgi:carnitine monooxygenase subunit
MNYQVDGFTADAATSATLPARLYTDPSVFLTEQDRIFQPGWHFLGHQNEARASGDYFTTKIIGQNVFVMRSKDGQLRAFHNVCQHRAHELVEGTGNTKFIVCPYHAWSYRCDGSLKTAAKGIDTGSIRLAEVRIEVIAGFIFGTLGTDTPSLSTLAPQLEADILQYVPRARDLVLLGQSGGVVNANWKVMIENSLECYHCLTRHKSFCLSVDMPGYRAETHGIVQHHRGPMHETDSSGARVEGDYVYWHVWPLTEISVRTYSPVFSVYINTPVAINQSAVTQKTYTAPDLPEAEKARILHHYVENNITDEEDVSIVESVQRGLGSAGYVTGRFASPSRDDHRSEHCVHQFQTLVRDALMK